MSAKLCQTLARGVTTATVGLATLISLAIGIACDDNDDAQKGISVPSVSATQVAPARPTPTPTEWPRVHDVELLKGALRWIAVGSSLLVAEAGTWSEIFRFSAELLDLSFPSQRYGYAATEGGLYSTADGGLTWNPVTSLPESPVRRYSVDFVDDTVGWAASVNVGFFETHDGGATWTRADWSNACPIAGGVHFDAVTPNVIFSACGGQSDKVVQRGRAFVRSSDGGQNWLTLQQSTDWVDGTLTDLHMADDRLGSVGFYRHYRVLVSTDGWRTYLEWSLEPDDDGYSHDHLSAVRLSSAAGGYVISNHMRVYATTDAGATWQLVFEAPGAPAPPGRRP